MMFICLLCFWGMVGDDVICLRLWCDLAEEEDVRRRIEARILERLGFATAAYTLLLNAITFGSTIRTSVLELFGRRSLSRVLFHMRTGSISDCYDEISLIGLRCFDGQRLLVIVCHCTELRAFQLCYSYTLKDK